MSRLSMRLSVAESGLRVQPSDFKIKVSHIIDETVDSLQSIWREAGYEESECQGLLGDILTKLKGLCSAELCAEQQILEHAKNQVLSKFHEFDRLCKKLGRNCPTSETTLGENYADRLSQLEKMISDIEIEISQRQEILNAKREEVETLSIQLGEELPSDYDGGDQYCELADIRIELIEASKKKLEQIQASRGAEMKNIATDILKCLSDLAVPKEGIEHLPDHIDYCELDNILVTHPLDLSLIGYHRHDLERLTLRLKGLIREKEKRKEELNKNGTEIARMWTLLRIPSSERAAFQSSFEMNLSLATLARGREELLRLKKIRMESLGTVITSLRDEIMGYWQELGVQSEEQMSSEFPLFLKPMEELDDLDVEHHEEFCSFLKNKVEQLRPLLLRIAKREAVVEERVELEHLMTNPERLTARGPKAREDRKREEEMQRRVKNLDKMTKEILGLVTAWEETNGTPFFYAGERYADRIDAQEEFYIESRNLLRNQRKKKDGKETLSSSAVITTPNARLSKKPTCMTAPVQQSNLMKTKEKNGILAPALPSAGVIASHPNVLIPSKAKGKMNSIQSEEKAVENLEHLNQENEVCDENEDIEQERQSIHSDCSDETEYTSMTEIKERASTCTIVRNVC